MRPDVSYYIISLYLTPDDFTYNLTHFDQEDLYKSRENSVDNSGYQVHGLNAVYFPTCLRFGRVDFGTERHSFILSADHANDFLLIRELEFRNSLETFLEMRLHAKRVFCFGQDFQKLVIGKEEKSKEKFSLKSKLFLLEISKSSLSLGSKYYTLGRITVSFLSKRSILSVFPPEEHWTHSIFPACSPVQ